MTFDSDLFYTPSSFNDYTYKGSFESTGVTDDTITTSGNVPSSLPKDIALGSSTPAPRVLVAN